MDGNDWMEFFVSVAPVYQKRISEPVWAKYPHADSEPWDSVGIFVEGFAFERQGKNPNFPLAANEVVRCFSKNLLSEASASDCWKKFSRALNSDGLKPPRGLNPARNPLAPAGHTITGLSAIEFAQQKAKDNPKGLVAWTVDALANNHTTDVHHEICRINGVGRKIASFFLRDIACRYRTFPNQDRYLLQPVDLWIQRTVNLVGKCAKKDDYNETAAWVTDNCEQPELANQGMWYFGAQVASPQILFHRILSSSAEAARDLMQKHAQSLREGADAWSQQQFPKTGTVS